MLLDMNELIFSDEESRKTRKGTSGQNQGIKGCSLEFDRKDQPSPADREFTESDRMLRSEVVIEA